MIARNRVDMVANVAPMARAPNNAGPADQATKAARVVKAAASVRRAHKTARVPRVRIEAPAAHQVGHPAASRAVPVRRRRRSIRSTTSWPTSTLRTTAPMTDQTTRRAINPDASQADPKVALKAKAAAAVDADVDVAVVRVDIRAAAKVAARAMVQGLKVRARRNAISAVTSRVNQHRQPA